MDFAYEPIASEITHSNEQTEQADLENRSQDFKDLKTEETFNHLEQKLDESISKTSSFFYKLWNEDQHINIFGNDEGEEEEEEEEGKEENKKTTEEKDSSDFASRSEKAAQDVLDAVDSKLRIVDDFIHNKDQQHQVADSAAKALKNTWAGWSSGLASLGDTLKNKLEEVSETGMSTVMNSSSPPDNKFKDNESKDAMLKLSTDENVYLSYKGESDYFSNSSSSSFSKEKKISFEANGNEKLKALCDKLVTEGKIKRETFWEIYFTEKQKILSSKTNEPEDTNKSKLVVPSWEDDEEEEEEEVSAEGSVQSDDQEPDIRVESRDDIVLVNKVPSSKKTEAAQVDDDEEDDEWE